MAKITITKDNLLTLAEFNALLEQTTAQSSPLEDILGLLRALIAFEDKYDMGSDVFYARFMRGEMGDNLPFIMWAGRYEAYLEAKQEIASHLPNLPTHPHHKHVGATVEPAQAPDLSTVLREIERLIF